MPIVQLPNGQNAEFPDNMPHDQIKAFIQKKFPSQQMTTTQQQPKPGWLQREGNFVDTNFNEPIERKFIKPATSMLGGFEQGLANIAPGLLNLGVSGANALGANIPKVPQFKFAPEDIYSKAGNIGSFFSGPGILKSLGKIPELAGIGKSAMEIPSVANGVRAAGNILNKSPLLSKVAGNSLLGGAYSPDHPLLGMSVGGLSPVIGKGVKSLFEKPLTAAFQKVNPTEVAESVQASHDALEKHAVDLFDTVGKLASERGISRVPINIHYINPKFLIKDSKFLPNTAAAKKLINSSAQGDYSALRELQADLWKNGTRQLKSELFTERNSGKEMIELKDMINSSIKKHFNDTGHHDLVKMLNEGIHDYANLKKTYYSHRTIANLVHPEEREIPENIMKTFNKNSEKMKRLRAQNPFVSKSLELQKNQKNAMKKLKYGAALGGASLAGAGTFALGHKAANAFHDFGQ